MAEPSNNVIYMPRVATVLPQGRTDLWTPRAFLRIVARRWRLFVAIFGGILALAILVAFMWGRSDARESRRYDRKAERDGDAELNAYNEMLARRARQTGQG